MSLTQFFRILWARRAIIMLSTIACFLGGLLVVMLVPTRYEATSRVMIDIAKPDPVTGEIISTQLLRTYAKTQIELIRDYAITGDVVDRLGWTNSPELAARYRANGEAQGQDFRRWLANTLSQNVSVKMLDGSPILEITYTSGNPEEAAQISNVVREVYSDHKLSSKRNEAAEGAAWFRTQAEKIRTELTEAEKRKTDFERANGIILQADNSDTETERLRALATITPGAAMAAAAPVINPVAQQLAQIDAAIAAASETLGPNHPDLQNMKRQRAVVAASAAKYGAGSAAGPTGPSIGALYSAQQAKVLAQRGKVVEAQQLATQVMVLRDQLLKTSARMSEMEQASASNESGLTLLGDAIPPQSAAFPNVPLIVGGALGMGFALGTLISLLTELLSRRVRGAEDLTFAGIPQLGSLPQLPGEGKRRRWARWLGFGLNREAGEVGA